VSRAAARSGWTGGARGLKKGALSAVDARTGADVTLEDDTLPITFEGMPFRLIEVRDQRYH
jgi:hypothetical protein